MISLKKLNIILSYLFIVFVFLDTTLTLIAISLGTFKELNPFDLYLWDHFGLPIGSLIHFITLFALYFLLFLWGIASKDNISNYALFVINSYILIKWGIIVFYNAYYLIFYH